MTHLFGLLVFFIPRLRMSIEGVAAFRVNHDS